MFSRYGQQIKDHLASFGLGAIPSFLATGLAGTVYGITSAVASAAGLGGAVSTVAGVLSTVFLAAPIGGIGMLLGAGSLVGVVASMDKLGIKDIKGVTAGLGVAAGIGASLMLGHHLSNNLDKTRTQPAISQTFNQARSGEKPVAAYYNPRPAMAFEMAPA